MFRSVCFALALGLVLVSPHAVHAAWGEVDPGFATGGWMNPSWPGDFGPSPGALITDSADRIVMAVNTGTSTVRFLRTSDTGTIDSSFGFLGSVSLTVPGASTARIVRLLPGVGNGLIAVGDAELTDGRWIVVFQLYEDGSLADKFGIDGFAFTRGGVTGVEAFAADAALNGAMNDQLEVVGWVEHQALARDLGLRAIIDLGAGGTLAETTISAVPSVGERWLRIADSGSGQSCHAVLAERDGALLVFGYSGPASPSCGAPSFMLPLSLPAAPSATLRASGLVRASNGDFVVAAWVEAGLLTKPTAYFRTVGATAATAQHLGKLGHRLRRCREHRLGRLRGLEACSPMARPATFSRWAASSARVGSSGRYTASAPLACWPPMAPSTRRCHSPGRSAPTATGTTASATWRSSSAPADRSPQSAPTRPTASTSRRAGSSVCRTRATCSATASRPPRPAPGASPLHDRGRGRRPSSGSAVASTTPHRDRPTRPCIARPIGWGASHPSAIRCQPVKKKQESWQATGVRSMRGRILLAASTLALAARASRGDGGPGASVQSTALSTFLVLAAVVLVVFAVVARSTRRPSPNPPASAYRLRSVLFVVAIFAIAGLLFATLSRTPYVRAGVVPDRVVYVTSLQFGFRFSDSPVENVADFGTVAAIEELDLPAGALVEFRVTSLDVNHNFGVFGPDNQIVAQTQAMPGYVNRLRVRLDRSGTYSVLCLEYCGASHHFMRTVFRAG